MPKRSKDRVLHNGTYYYMTKSGYYTSWDKGAENNLLHRVIWVEHNGPIPEGFHVHHINECKTDNRIENLQLLSNSEHMKLHGQKSIQNPEYLSKIKTYLVKGRENAKPWHSTEEGRKWHAEHGRKGILKRLQDPAVKAKMIADLQIGKEKAHAWHKTEEGKRWHSENAKRNAANRVYVDTPCIICGTLFKAWDRRSKQICSPTCRTRMDRHKTLVEKVCLCCGKTYQGSKYKDGKGCSPSCAAKIRWGK